MVRLNPVETLGGLQAENLLRSVRWVRAAGQVAVLPHYRDKYFLELAVE